MGKYLRKVVSGASSIFVFGSLAALANYTTRFVLARELSPEGYGLFFAVLSFVMFFASIRELGIPYALAQHISHFNIKKQFGRCKSAVLGAALTQTAISIVLAIVLFTMRDYLAARYFKHPQSEPLILLVIGYMLISVLFIVIRSILQGSQRLLLYGSFDFMRDVLFLTFIIIFLKLSYGVIAPGIAYVVSGIILVLLYTKPMREFWKKLTGPIQQFKGVTKRIVSFGMYAFGGDFSVRLIRYFDTIVLTAFWTLEDVGIYNVVVPTCMLFALIGKSIGTTILPISAEMNAQKNKETITKTVGMLHKYVSLIAIPLGVAVAYAEEILTLLFGHEYAAGAVPFQILMVGISFFTVTKINNGVLIGIGKPKKVAWVFAIAAVSNGVLNLALIPKMGIGGAAIATSVSYILAFFLSMNALRHGIDYTINVKGWMIAVILSAVTVLIAVHMKTNLTLNFYGEILVVLISIALLHTFLGWLFGIYTSDIIHYVKKIRRA